MDLRNVKCPMNLVLVKEAIFEEKFKHGGVILTESDIARKNIVSFLDFKKIRYHVNDDGLLLSEHNTGTF